MQYVRAAITRFSILNDFRVPHQLHTMPLASSHVIAAIVVVFSLFVTITPQSAISQEVKGTSDNSIQTFSGLDASLDTVYFDLHSKTIVSAGGEWDLAFKGTTILVNGEAQIVDKAFQKVSNAPDEGYRSDQPGQPAIPTGNLEGWFDYDASSHQITPVPFRTIALKLARGGYGKLEVVDYYAADGTPRSYMFRYQLSESGSF